MTAKTANSINAIGCIYHTQAFLDFFLLGTNLGSTERPEYTRNHII